MGPNYGKLPILFPYHSHLGILMGVVWETYHKGVPLLGVPENSTELGSSDKFVYMIRIELYPLSCLSNNS